MQNTAPQFPLSTVLLCGAFLLSACGIAGKKPVDPEAEPSPTQVQAASSVDLSLHELDPALVDALTNDGRVDVIVAVNDATAMDWQRQSDSALLRLHSAFEIVAREGGAQKRRILEELGISTSQVIEDYENLGTMHLQLRSRDELQALANHPEVTAVRPNITYEAFGSTPRADLALINQPAAAAAGKLGAGATVAVVDTGIDFTRAPFNCTPGAAGCPVAYRYDFGDSNNSSDAQGVGTHGTNVAGVTLSVAPAARIAALDVFVGTNAAYSAILAAINWSISNKAAYNIVAMNMSLGGGSYTAPCSTDFLADGVNRAKLAGIISVIASGNNGTTNAIASPACIPAAVSVGAVYDSNIGAFGSDATTAPDKVAFFSNSASFLSVLAPGVNITAAGVTMSGTSQATPHVSGAVAVLRAAMPTESIDSAIARLKATGKAVTDIRNGLVFPRVDVAAAVNSDVSVVGTTQINGGALVTETTKVTITSKITQGAPTAICLSNAPSSACTAWIPYSSSVSWNLASGSGSKQVFTWWKNAAGIVSQAPAASITLDTGVVHGAININNGAISTRSTVVTINAGITQGTPVAVCLTNGTGTCTTWRSYSRSLSWSLSSGIGVKTVVARWKDALGTISAPASANIWLLP